MSANSVVGLPERRNAFLPIAVGGLSAGILDLTQALILFGTRVPLGIARPAGCSWRRYRDLCYGRPTPFLYRSLHGNCLLHREPSSGVFEAALVNLWIVLRRRGRSSNDARCLAALGASRIRSLQTSRPASRHLGPHVHSRPANFLQCSTIREIENTNHETSIFSLCSATCNEPLRRAGKGRIPWSRYQFGR